REVFVFSFYEAPHPDELLARLAGALGAGPAGGDQEPSYQRTLDELSRVRGPRGLLLVLDGFEKAQDDGLRGGVFGEVIHPSLRDLPQRIAAGALPGVAALVTSRSPIASLEEAGAPYYQRVDVGDFPPDAAVALLRRRGVHGSDAELRALAEEC